jgi:hypothetical protein
MIVGIFGMLRPGVFQNVVSLFESNRLPSSDSVEEAFLNSGCIDSLSPD